MGATAPWSESLSLTPAAPLSLFPVQAALHCIYNAESDGPRPLTEERKHLNAILAQGRCLLETYFSTSTEEARDRQFEAARTASGTEALGTLLHAVVAAWDPSAPWLSPSALEQPPAGSSTGGSTSSTGGSTGGTGDPASGKLPDSPAALKQAAWAAVQRYIHEAAGHLSTAAHKVGADSVRLGQAVQEVQEGVRPCTDPECVLLVPLPARRAPSTHTSRRLCVGPSRRGMCCRVTPSCDSPQGVTVYTRHETGGPMCIKPEAAP